MGQFKPMVKMQTTEPSVELKLKKGGKVAKKADGGMMGSPMSAAGAMPPSMPARGGMPMAGAPMKPSLAARRRAMRGMPAGAGPAGPIGSAAQMQPSMPSSAPTMKKGGKAEGGKMDKAQDKAMIKKAFKQHDMQEHKSGKGTKLALKKGGKMATGGVVRGQGGYAKGGVINTEGQGGGYRNTKMDTVKPNHSAAKTGGVKNGNSGGYKQGGKIKKMATGGVVNGQGGYAAGGQPIPQRSSPQPVDIGNGLRRTYSGTIINSEGYPVDENGTRYVVPQYYGQGHGGVMPTPDNGSDSMTQYELERKYPNAPYQPTQTTTAMTQEELERRYPTPDVERFPFYIDPMETPTPPSQPPYYPTPEYPTPYYPPAPLEPPPPVYPTPYYPPTPLEPPRPVETYQPVPPREPTYDPFSMFGGPDRPVTSNKRGGAIKKAYAAGGTVNTGRPVAMPQGRKPASKPVAINELSGTFKKGGKVC